MAYDFQRLSGSTNGLPIKVTATVVGSADTIHTAHATSDDEIYIDACVTGATARTLTIAFGGVLDPDNLIPITLEPNEGLVRVIAGVPLSGGLVVKAFASAADEVNIVGKVHRIT